MTLIGTDPPALVTDLTIYDPRRDYGAVYDGATDAAPEINDCIDAATALGGGIVELRAVGGLDTVAKRVALLTDVVIKTGVWLRGLGPATTISGSASIRIPGSGEQLADRITISDMTIQPSGSAPGILLDNEGGTGGLQLGWPRISVQDIVISDPPGIGLLLDVGITIEARIINVIVMRNAGIGMAIYATDNYLIGCTVGGAANGGGQPGIAISGGNSHLSCCKSYGQVGSGFAISGAGRHVISGCEAQDCGIGYDIQSQNNSLVGFIADTCSEMGVSITGNNNIVSGSIMGPGGGGTGATTKVGVWLAMGSRYNDVRVAAGNALVAVCGDFESNSVFVAGQDAVENVTYAATFTPNVRTGRTKKMTLTGNVAIKAPHECWPGVRLVFLLKQDATGGRTITFDSCYRTNASWSPALAANTTERIEFEHDGMRWVQCGALPVTDRAAIVTDNFNRANGALGNAVTGQAWSTSDAKVVINSNKANAPTASNFTQTSHAWIDAGVSDATAQATMLDDNAFLTFRVVDATNFYYWTNGVVARVVAGTATRIDSGGGTFTTNDVLKVTAVGATLRCYKNGTLVMILPASSHLGATKFGIGIAHSASLGVDDFSVT